MIFDWDTHITISTNKQVDCIKYKLLIKGFILTSQFHHSVGEDAPVIAQVDALSFNRFWKDKPFKIMFIVSLSQLKNTIFNIYTHINANSYEQVQTTYP